ncbi:MAG TPA: thiamine phosphate synthase [Xanthomonadales bacterium]|nr:thiamine phosphate synthase [Xanthomonadales bacterium]
MTSMKFFPPHGLYAITPQYYPDAQRLLADCAAALQGGARLLQFRDKSADRDWRLEVARRLNGLCRDQQVPLIINDDFELARQIGAAGVHLGREDASISQVAAALGPDSLIGVSCYDRLDRAQSATEQGASYLAFGSMFPSATKPHAVRCSLQTLTAAKAFGLPLVAIGGITAENGGSLIEAGADYLAVVGAVFDVPDVRGAAQQLAALWEDGNGRATPETRTAGYEYQQ